VCREAADAARLLELTRGPWRIENRLHDVWDVTLGEDACRVRTAAVPPVLAAWRNAVVHLLEGVRAASKAAAARCEAACPFDALALLSAQT
jgi:predicted transposase YbfD/YdcC